MRYNPMALAAFAGLGLAASTRTSSDDGTLVIEGTVRDGARKPMPKVAGKRAVATFMAFYLELTQ
jgi:hypothetical protein